MALLRAGRREQGLVYGVLSAFWTWMAIAYHAAFFSAINPAAWIFAAGFLLAATAFAWAAVRRRREPVPRTALRLTVGWCLVLYALIGYPALARLFGQHYPAVPTFGLPCPTTIFTLGALTLLPGAPRRLAIVPLAWAVIGSIAAFRLAVFEDFGLAIAAVLALPFVASRAGGRVRAQASNRW